MRGLVKFGLNLTLSILSLNGVSDDKVLYQNFNPSNQDPLKVAQEFNKELDSRYNQGIYNIFSASSSLIKFYQNENDLNNSSIDLCANLTTKTSQINKIVSASTQTILKALNSSTQSADDLLNENNLEETEILSLISESNKNWKDLKDQVCECSDQEKDLALINKSIEMQKIADAEIINLLDVEIKSLGEELKKNNNQKSNELRKRQRVNAKSDFAKILYTKTFVNEKFAEYANSLSYSLKTRSIKKGIEPNEEDEYCVRIGTSTSCRK